MHAGLTPSIANSRPCLCGLHPLWKRHRLREAGAARGGCGTRRQGRAVRLQDVRPMHTQLHGHVLPHELPEEPSQRSLRRRARRTAIARFVPRCAVCGWRPSSGRSAYPEARKRCAPAAGGRPPAAGAIVLAAGVRGCAPGSRHEIRRRAGSRVTRCPSCRGIPPPAGSSACCAPASLR